MLQLATAITMFFSPQEHVLFFGDLSISAYLFQVLQKLGKADETKDEQFEQCVQNFKRQEVKLFQMHYLIVSG